MKKPHTRRGSTRISLVVFGAISAVAAFNSCGKKSSSDSDSQTTTTTATPTDSPSPSVSSGTLALAIPAELSVVSPYSAETVATALAGAALADSYAQAGAINVGGTAMREDGDFNLEDTGTAPPSPPPPPPVGSVTDAQKSAILSGPPKGYAQARAQRQYMLRKVTAEDGGISACLYKDTAVGTVNSPPCYGPGLQFQNHPDASGPDSPTGNIGGGDLGIWEATMPGGESCIAAKMNGVISNVSGEVDDAIGLASMLVCISRLEGGSLPDAGETLDLMPAAVKAKAAASAMPFTFTQAKIVRAAADHNSHPVYTTELVYEVAPSQPPGPGGMPLNNPAPQTKIQTMKLKHSPMDDNNDTYLGKLTMITDIKGAEKVTNCDPNAGKVRTALTIRYNKPSAERIQYEMRRGNFMSGTSDAGLFDSHENARYPSTGPGSSDCNMGGEYANFDLNPKYGTGKVAYSWFAGSAGENGRSMVVNVGIDSNSEKTGCGYFGFGESFSTMASDIDALAEGSSTTKLLNQFICNWSGPGASARSTKTLTQRQCIKQDANGTYMPTSNNIAFSPQNSCQRDAGASTVFQVSKSSPAVWENTTTTMGLLPIVSSYGSGQSVTNAVLKGDIAPPPAFAGF